MPSKPSAKTAKAPKSSKTRRSELYHPLLIVPLHPGKAKAAAPQFAPQLTYRNGPLLTSSQVFTIFWGAAWNEAPQNSLLPRVNQFFDFILTSQLLDQLAEYSVSGQQIGRGAPLGRITLTSTDPGTTGRDHPIYSL